MTHISRISSTSEITMTRSLKATVCWDVVLGNRRFISGARAAAQVRIHYVFGAESLDKHVTSQIGSLLKIVKERSCLSSINEGIFLQKSKFLV